MIITNKFTTNYDIYTDAVIGAPVLPSLLFDFAKAKRHDLRLTVSRAGTATVFDAAGFISSVPANTSRINHDPYSGECLGLLSEESRTNVVRNTDNGSYASVGTALAPDRSTAYKAVPTGSVTFPGVGTAANQSFDISSLSVGQSRDFTFSGYFAPWGAPSYRPYIVIGAFGTSLTARYALIIFNPDSGTFSGKTLGTGWSEVIPPVVKTHPCGMYYVSWTVRYTQESSYTSVQNYLQILNELNAQTYTANGTSGFQFVCMQFEDGYAATSYIPTTAAAVTRNTDVVSYPVSSSWYNPSEGSIFLDFKYGEKIESSRVLSIDSSVSNRISILGSNGAMNAGSYLEVNDNNATATVVLIPGLPVANARHYVSASYKKDDFRICRDGGSVLSDTSSNVPQNLTTLRFGGLAGSGVLNGHIAKFSYFPKAFTSEELVILTTR